MSLLEKYAKKKKKKRLGHGEKHVLRAGAAVGAGVGNLRSLGELLPSGGYHHSDAVKARRLKAVPKTIAKNLLKGGLGGLAVAGGLVAANRARKALSKPKKLTDKTASPLIPTEYLIHMREEMEGIWRSEVAALHKTAVSIEKAYEVDPKSKDKMKAMAQKALQTAKDDPKVQAIANNPKAKEMAARAEAMGRKIMSQKGGVHKQLASGYGSLPKGTKGMS